MGMKSRAFYARAEKAEFIMALLAVIAALATLLVKGLIWPVPGIALLGAAFNFLRGYVLLTRHQRGDLLRLWAAGAFVTGAGCLFLGVLALRCLQV